jgi:ATP-dependent RNA helicase DDX19/DBP5
VTTLCVPGVMERDATIQGHVVVGTPGTIQDLIKRRKLTLDKVKVFVLDEADSMLDMQGLGDVSQRIIR